MSHKVLGFTEDYTDCDCCGRCKLKGTYAVQYEDGQIIHFGSRCIKARHAFNKESEIKEAANAYKAEVTKLAREEFAYCKGPELRHKLTTLEFDTPEHTEVWDLLTDLERKIKQKYCNEYVKHIML